jgi:hypothetical protein
MAPIGMAAGLLNNAQQWQNQIQIQIQNQSLTQQAAYNQALRQRQHEWTVNGVSMTFEQFLDQIAPGVDNHMRSFLILKYKK